MAPHEAIAAEGLPVQCWGRGVRAVTQCIWLSAVVAPSLRRSVRPPPLRKLRWLARGLQGGSEGVRGCASAEGLGEASEVASEEASEAPAGRVSTWEIVLGGNDPKLAWSRELSRVFRGSALPGDEAVQRGALEGVLPALKRGLGRCW